MQIFFPVSPVMGRKLKLSHIFLFFDIEFPEKDEYNRCVNYLVR